jgi:formylglycine-generating enzyme required for sulfatase activity
MHGNVREWTADWYQAAYPTGNVTDPTGPSSGFLRVIRGGSWGYAANLARSAYRFRIVPDLSYYSLGFRVGFKFTGVHTVASASNLEMLWVESGTFTMGSPTTETGRSADREDEHNVTLTKGFYLGKYEVTQAQYEAVMTGNSNQLSATPSQYTGNDRPVEKVSWNNVQVFLTRLNAAEQAAGRLPSGWSYVLPTESEWEYACRAGTTTVYSWGSSIATSNANYDQSGIGQTRDVGQYAANPWGFYDMHGNVREWTADWYQAAYPSGTVTDPTGPASGSRRVLRGGSWFDTADIARSANRYRNGPANSDLNLGFRLSLRPASQ